MSDRAGRTAHSLPRPEVRLRTTTPRMKRCNIHLQATALAKEEEQLAKGKGKATPSGKKRSAQ